MVIEKKEKKITKKAIKKAEKRTLKKADKEWTIAVKKRDNYKCVICESTKLINSHHVLPRENRASRHIVFNGISLCSYCHKFSLNNSPHRNPFVFFLWLKKNRPEQYEVLRRYVEDPIEMNILKTTQDNITDSVIILTDNTERRLEK